MTRPIAVYLSHADTEEDRALRKRIERALKYLVLTNRISIQHRDSVPSGELRTHQIGQMVDAADIFLPFMDQDYLGDDLVYNTELPIALRRRESDTLRIWPLFVGPMAELEDHPVQPIAGLVGFPSTQGVTLDLLQTRHEFEEEMVKLANALDATHIRPLANEKREVRITKVERAKRHVRSAELAELENRFALVVGIDQFAGAPELRYCRADALALEQKLKSLGYEVRSLYENHPGGIAARPTEQTVLRTLEVICKNAAESDLIFVHFSTHGDLRNGQAILLAQDSAVEGLNPGGIPLATIEDMLLECKAARVVVSLDACHSGFDRRRGTRALGEPPPSVRDFYETFYGSAEGYAVISACAADQVAYEDEASGHGIFTRLILEALDGEIPPHASAPAARAEKQFVTLDDVKEYVSVRMRQWCVAKSHSPQEFTIRSQMIGDLILADYRAHERRRTSPDTAAANG